METLQQQNEKAFPVLPLSALILGSILPLCLLLYEILACVTVLFPPTSDLIGTFVITGVVVSFSSL